MDSFKPTPEQEEIINTDNSALIKAGPGTGKTRTAIEKARNRINLIPKESFEQVYFLSFSNSAIHRLATDVNIRFSKNEKKRVRFMTYHSCCAEILHLYGRFVGLPPRIRIMDTLEEKLVFLEKGWSTSDNGYNEKLSSLSKERGLLSFNTLIPLAIKLLSTSTYLRKIINRKYPLIIVDEFQDTSEDQWKLLYQLGLESQVVAFGDPNQIIYSSMHEATSERLEEFKNWKNIDESNFSSQNFRCNNNDINEFANSLLNGTPITLERNSNVTLYKLNYRSELRSVLALIWKNIQEQAGTNQTIGFLTPSNLIAEDVAVALRNPPSGSRVSFPVYCYLARDEATHDAVLLALTALRDYAVTENENACGKAAVALLAMDLAWTRKKMSLQRLNSITRILKIAIERNTNKLSELLVNIKNVQKINDMIPLFLEALSEINGFETTYKRIVAYDPKRLGIDTVITNDSQLALFDEVRTNRHPKGLEGYDAGKGGSYILNYHKAKGREFDFVTMVIDPRGESNKIPLDELRRLYYVCATRAKKWLGVIYYSNELGRVLGPVIAPSKE